MGDGASNGRAPTSLNRSHIVVVVVFSFSFTTGTKKPNGRTIVEAAGFHHDQYC